MDDEEQRRTRDDFDEAVNMTASELESWLDTEESKSVGESTRGESKGHQSGRWIARILRSQRGQLTEHDYEHMRKVTGYVRRHLAQRPNGEIRDTPWRYSLMNWGHDPLK